MMRLDRTKETFMVKISSKDPLTQRGYKIALNNFENYCMEKFGKTEAYLELKDSPDEAVYDFLQGWINWNSKLAPRTVTNYFSRIKKYLHYRGIKLDMQDIKEELDFKRRVDEELYGLSISDIQAIFKELPYKNRVSFLCQLSGLMRIGEIVQLKKKHLILSGQNIIVKIPGNIAKFNKGRTTFLSKEASRLVRPIVRELDDNDLIFGTNKNPQISIINFEQTLRRNLIKIGLDMKYESTGRFMINTHGFRAYGITKISRHDPNFAKKLAGQKGYLLQYDRMTDDEKLELYQKYESDLLIDDSAKQRAKIESLEVEKNEIESLKIEMAEMREMLMKDRSKQHSLKWYDMVSPEDAKQTKEFIEKIKNGEIVDNEE